MHYFSKCRLADNKSFECLFAGCDRTFPTQEERRIHMTIGMTREEVKQLESKTPKVYTSYAHLFSFNSYE